MKHSDKILLVVVLTMIMVSCKVTQPYRRAAGVAGNDLYRDVNTTDTTTIADIPWRQMFRDTLLQELISEGISNNNDLKIAVTRIRAAEANYQQSKAAFFPSLSANASATAQKLPTYQLGSSNIYQLYMSSSWEVGVWGKLKSAKRAALAALLQSDAYRRAVQTQLIANIATSYYALQAYDAQLQTTIATVENRKQDVETMKILKESDVVTGAAVVQSQANQYSVAITIPDIKQNIRETENAICILLGRSPGSIARDSLKNESAAVDLKTGIPVQLLANRPDVQEAEYQLRNATELTNVARTYFYPSLNLTAEGGLGSNTLSHFFDASNILGNVIGGLTQPVFNNGLNKQRLRVAQAQQEEYLYTFRQTLLTAGQEVSNALFDYQTASDKIALRGEQILYLQKSVEFTKALLRYTATTNYTDVLTSEQSLLAAQLNSISDKLQQLQAVVTLYRSLGGGWKN